MNEWNYFFNAPQVVDFIVNSNIQVILCVGGIVPATGNFGMIATAHITGKRIANNQDLAVVR